MATRRKASIIIYDLKNSSELAKAFVLKFAFEHVYQPKNRHGIYKLILLNSQETYNRFDYLNIAEKSTDIEKHNPIRLKSLIEECSASEDNADWFEALTLGIYSLQDDFKKEKGIEVYQIIFLTQFSNVFCQATPCSIIEITEKINNLNAYCYFFGLENLIEETLCSSDDIKNWTKKFTEISTRNTNIQVLQKIVTKLDNAIVCNEKIGQHLVHSYKSYKLSTQTWKVPLSIGSRLEVKCQTTTVGRPGNPLKIRSGVQKQWVWRNAFDPSVIYRAQEVINGHLKHGKFVEHPDRKVMQIQGPRSFRVLGFTDLCNVPNYMCKGQSAYVLPLSDGFRLIVNMLRKRNQCIIARRVYNQNLNPKICALVPHPTECRLILQNLPYVENLQPTNFDFREREENLGQKEDAEGEIGEKLEQFFSTGFKFDLSPRYMQNITSQAILRKVASDMMTDVDFDKLDYVPCETNLHLDEETWPSRDLATHRSEKKEILPEGEFDNDFD